jgi:hypothetical protein
MESTQTWFLFALFCSFRYEERTHISHAELSSSRLVGMQALHVVAENMHNPRMIVQVHVGNIMEKKGCVLARSENRCSEIGSKTIKRNPWLRASLVVYKSSTFVLYFSSQHNLHLDYKFPKCHRQRTWLLVALLFPTQISSPSFAWRFSVFRLISTKPQRKLQFFPAYACQHPFLEIPQFDSENCI